MAAAAGEVYGLTADTHGAFKVHFIFITILHQIIFQIYMQVNYLFYMLITFSFKFEFFLKIRKNKNRKYPRSRT